MQQPNSSRLKEKLPLALPTMVRSMEQACACACACACGRAPSRAPILKAIQSTLLYILPLKRITRIQGTSDCPSYYQITNSEDTEVSLDVRAYEYFLVVKTRTVA
jgi:hypothetical protein